jgi:hypothetical protein
MEDDAVSMTDLANGLAAVALTVTALALALAALGFLDEHNLRR